MEGDPCPRYRVMKANSCLQLEHGGTLPRTGKALASPVEKEYKRLVRKHETGHYPAPPAYERKHNKVTSQQSKKKMNNNNSSSSDDDDREIVEDRPVMRSVAMMSQRAASAGVGPAAVGGDYSSPLAYTSPFDGAAPALRFGSEGSPSAVKKSPASSPLPTRAGSSPQQQQQQQQATVWDVRSLAPIPAFYQLERSHVTISDSTPPQVLAQRISSCLRKESIAAKYNDQEVRRLFTT